MLVNRFEMASRNEEFSNMEFRATGTFVLSLESQSYCLQLVLNSEAHNDFKHKTEYVTHLLKSLSSSHTIYRPKLQTRNKLLPKWDNQK